MFANADVPRGLHDMIETAAKPDETTQKSEAGERAFLAHFFRCPEHLGTTAHVRARTAFLATGLGLVAISRSCQ